MTQTKFQNVSCSQCGQDFGPGEHGFSHCHQHPGFKRDQMLATNDTVAVPRELLVSMYNTAASLFGGESMFARELRDLLAKSAA